MSEIIAHHLKDKDHIRIYDPTSGSGSLLLTIGKSAAKKMKNKDKVEYYAQELNGATYNLTRMNLIMRGINPSDIHTRHADTLEEDWPLSLENNNEPLRVDACVSNPPYSQHWNTSGKESDNRFKGYGIAPSTKADFAFLLHDLYHLNETGILTIILPHGVLFRGGEEERIRTKLVEDNVIDAIIGLPPNIFYGTGIPTTIMILKKQRINSDILFIDASRCFEKEGNQNKLRHRDIKLIADAVADRKDRVRFSRKISKNEIVENGYNLNIPRYINSAEDEPGYDLYACMHEVIPEKEVDALQAYWNVFPHLKNKIFKNMGSENMALITQEFSKVIEEDEDVKKFRTSFLSAIQDLPGYLFEEIIKEKKYSNLEQKEEEIGLHIFSLLRPLSLVDEYEGYQTFMNHWTEVSPDLETIQNDSPEVIKAFNTESKDGKIIPIKLLQSQIAELRQRVDNIRDKETEISKLEDDNLSLLEELSQEEKDSCPAIDANGTSFIPKEANKYLKPLEEDSEARETALYKAVENFTKNDKKSKEIKKAIKQIKNDLEKKNLETLQNLSGEQIDNLLKKKWIDPLIDQLSLIPEKTISELNSKILDISSRYENSLPSIEKQLDENLKSLTSLLDEREGNTRDVSAIKKLKDLLG